jgi:predicted TPR repeat methyltransferase
MTTSFFHSCGNLLADRRYTFGQELSERGDMAAAADLLAQAVELAPEFASGWFALAQARERLGASGDAIYAYRKALALDPLDRHGAGLHLMRLKADGLHDMPPDYVRALFDQYADRFDTALMEGLAYRGPAVLLTAVEKACIRLGRRLRFEAALDLGCGTGLGGAAFRPLTDRLVGVDLSPRMIEVARRKNLYDHLAVGDLLEFVGHADPDAFDLMVAADVFAYIADLAPLTVACGKALARGGLLAFSVETHGGDDVILGEKLRFAHSREHVRAALARAGLTLLTLEDAATRNEGAAPVPGLIAVATRR